MIWTNNWKTKSRSTQRSDFNLLPEKTTRTEAPPPPSQLGDRATGSDIYNVTLSPETDDDVAMQDRASDDEDESPHVEYRRPDECQDPLLIPDIAR